MRLWFTLFSSQCLNFLIFPPDAVFPRTVLQVWVPNQGSRLSEGLWFYPETFTAESLRGLWVDHTFTLPGKLTNGPACPAVDADMQPALCCAPRLVPPVCATPCDPMDCSLQASLSPGCSRQEYWSG